MVEYNGSSCGSSHPVVKFLGECFEEEDWFLFFLAFENEGEGVIIHQLLHT